jgi:hypothetical protein
MGSGGKYGNGGGTGETVGYSIVLHLPRKAHVHEGIPCFRHKHSPIKKLLKIKIKINNYVWVTWKVWD